MTINYQMSKNWDNLSGIDSLKLFFSVLTTWKFQLNTRINSSICSGKTTNQKKSHHFSYDFIAESNADVLSSHIQVTRYSNLTCIKTLMFVFVGCCCCFYFWFWLVINSNDEMRMIWKLLPFVVWGRERKKKSEKRLIEK